MMKRLGYVHDRWVGAKIHDARVGIGNPKLDINLEMEPFAPAARNQGPTNACVSFAFNLLIWTQMHRLASLEGNSPPPYPSEQWGYEAPRLLERGKGNTTPLVDKGTTPGLFLAGAHQLGMMPEVLIPWNPSKVNEEATVAEAVAALSYTLENYTLLGVAPGARPDAIIDAVDAGTGAAIAIQLDSRAMHDDGPDVIGVMDPSDIQGAHMVAIIGYRRTETGRRQFRIRNSYGWRWRDQGDAWLDEDLVRHPTQCFGAASVRVMRSF